MAIKHNHLDIVKYLLSLPEIEGKGFFSFWERRVCCISLTVLMCNLVNKSAKRGDAALHFAADNNNLEFLKAILSHPELDLQLKNNKGETALDVATKNYHEHHVELLTEAAQDQRKFQSGYKAADTVVKSKISKIESDKARDETEVEVDPRKVSSQSSPLQEEEEAFMSGGRSATIFSNFSMGEEQDQEEDGVAFLRAASTGNLGRIINLLKSGIDVNYAGRGRMFGRTALHLAALKGHIHILKYLLENKATKVNLQNKSGNTALHFAVRSNKIKVVETILSHPEVDQSIENTVS